MAALRAPIFPQTDAGAATPQFSVKVSTSTIGAPADNRQTMRCWTTRRCPAHAPWGEPFADIPLLDGQSEHLSVITKAGVLGKRFD